MADLIDRAAAIEWFEGYLHIDPDEHISPNRIISDIKSFHTTDAKPVVHGEWKTKDYDSAYCSCCIKTYTGFFASEWPYCPNCGAKMNKGKEGV